MAFEIEVDREHIENTLSVTYTMGQINSYMEIIRELKEIPEDNVVDIRKTIGRLQEQNTNAVGVKSGGEIGIGDGTVRRT